MADFSTIKKIRNLFRLTRQEASGMHTDTSLSQQPEGTYRNAWGVSNGDTEGKGGGIYNASGMEVCGRLPDGFIERGYHFLEESDRHLIFSYNEAIGKSEIGYIKDCQYTKVLNDDDIDGCSLEFGTNEWIPIESKFLRDGTCYNIHIYWTNGSYYKTLNIDKPELPINCDDIYLLRCNAVPVPSAFSSETGGTDLYGGIYQYVAQFEDTDGNTTNWFYVSNPVSLGTPNNRAGEISEQAIHVQLKSLSNQYHKINLAVIKTISGATSAWMLTQLYFGTSSLEFVHRSRSQEKYEIDLEAILSKKNGYFRGYDLFQYDGHLMPYNLLGEANPNLMEMTSSLEVNYVIEGVPLRYAHLYSGLRADEVYDIALVENYCDGTRSRAFTIPGREPAGNDKDIINKGDDNCLECKAERWSIENTAYRTELICDDPKMVSDVDENINVDPGKPIFVPNPKPDTDPLGEDDSGVPTEEQIKKMREENELKQMECICSRLYPVFVLYDQIVLKKYIANPLINIFDIKSVIMDAGILSDPVAIASAMCGCEDLQKKGSNDGDDDTQPETMDCESCCKECSNKNNDGIETRGDYCEACLSQCNC